MDFIPRKDGISCSFENTLIDITKNLIQTVIELKECKNQNFCLTKIFKHFDIPFDYEIFISLHAIDIINFQTFKHMEGEPWDLIYIQVLRLYFSKEMRINLKIIVTIMHHMFQVFFMIFRVLVLLEILLLPMITTISSMVH